MRVLFKHFTATFKSLDKLAHDAADFATRIGTDRLITIAQAQSLDERIITVWYWGKAETCSQCGYDLTGNESGTCPECGSKQTRD